MPDSDELSSRGAGCEPDQPRPWPRRSPV